MTFWEWLGLAGVCLAGAASPGPSLAVVLGAVVNGGRASGLGAAWAHALGVGLYATLTVFGITALIAYLPWLFSAVQVTGALYLLWLASRLLRSTGGPSPPADEVDARRVGAAARDGFAVAFLNPKLAVFMLALFSQFVKPGAGAATTTLLIATATLIDGLWYSLVTLLLSRRGWLEALRRRAGIIDRVFGLLLALLALSILWLSIARA